VPIQCPILASDTELENFFSVAFIFTPLWLVTKYRVIVLSEPHRYFPLLWASHSAATVYTMGEQTGNGKRYWSDKIMLL